MKKIVNGLTCAIIALSAMMVSCDNTDLNEMETKSQEVENKPGNPRLTFNPVIDEATVDSADAKSTIVGNDTLYAIKATISAAEYEYIIERQYKDLNYAYCNTADHKNIVGLGTSDVVASFAAEDGNVYTVTVDAPILGWYAELQRPYWKVKDINLTSLRNYAEKGDTLYTEVQALVQFTSEGLSMPQSAALILKDSVMRIMLNEEDVIVGYYYTGYREPKSETIEECQVVKTNIWKSGKETDEPTFLQLLPRRIDTIDLGEQETTDFGIFKTSDMNLQKGTKEKDTETEASAHFSIEKRVDVYNSVVSNGTNVFYPRYTLTHRGCTFSNADTTIVFPIADWTIAEVSNVLSAATGSIANAEYRKMTNNVRTTYLEYIQDAFEEGILYIKDTELIDEGWDTENSWLKVVGKDVQVHGEWVAKYSKSDPIVTEFDTTFVRGLSANTWEIYTTKKDNTTGKNSIVPTNADKKSGKWSWTVVSNKITEDVTFASGKKQNIYDGTEYANIGLTHKGKKLAFKNYSYEYSEGEVSGPTASGSNEKYDIFKQNTKVTATAGNKQMIDATAVGNIYVEKTVIPEDDQIVGRRYEWTREPKSDVVEEIMVTKINIWKSGNETTAKTYAQMLPRGIETIGLGEQETSSFGVFISSNVNLAKGTSGIDYETNASNGFSMIVKRVDVYTSKVSNGINNFEPKYTLTHRGVTFNDGDTTIVFPIVDWNVTEAGNTLSDATGIITNAEYKRMTNKVRTTYLEYVQDASEAGTLYKKGDEVTEGWDTEKSWIKVVGKNVQVHGEWLRKHTIGEDEVIKFDSTFVRDFSANKWEIYTSKKDNTTGKNSVVPTNSAKSHGYWSWTVVSNKVTEDVTFASGTKQNVYNGTEYADIALTYKGKKLAFKNYSYEYSEGSVSGPTANGSNDDYEIFKQNTKVNATASGNQTISATAVGTIYVEKADELVNEGWDTEKSWIKVVGKDVQVHGEWVKTFTKSSPVVTKFDSTFVRSLSANTWEIYTTSKDNTTGGNMIVPSTSAKSHGYWNWTVISNRISENVTFATGTKQNVYDGVEYSDITLTYKGKKLAFKNYSYEYSEGSVNGPTANGSNDSYDIYKQTTKVNSTASGNQTISATANGTIYVEKVVTPPFFPSEYGKFEDAKFSATVNPYVANSWYFGCTMTFEKGSLALPIDQQGNPDWDHMTWWPNIKDASLNGAYYVNRYGKWYPTIASDQNAGMEWSLCSAQGGHGLYILDYAGADTYGDWNCNDKNDKGQHTVLTKRFRMENNTSTGTVTLYFNNVKTGSWTYAK